MLNQIEEVLNYFFDIYVLCIKIYTTFDVRLVKFSL